MNIFQMITVKKQQQEISQKHLDFIMQHIKDTQLCRTKS